MACRGATGQGSTVSFSVNTAIGRVRSCQLPDWVMEAIDKTGLDTTEFMCKAPGDVTDPGELVVEAIFDTINDLPQTGAIEDCTVTFKAMSPGSGGGQPATLIGSGFISTSGLPNLATGELMILTLTFTYDGDGTVPAFTAEVPGT